MRCFIKIFTQIFLLLVFFHLNSYAEVVKKIEVTGNDRVSKETIVVFGDIAVGKDYESSDVNILIKKLYDTTLFSNISVNIKNNVLTIVVKENPMINSVKIEGEKAKKFKEKILELLSLRENASFIEGYVKNDINLIKQFYSSLGHYFVKIEAEIAKLDKNRVNLSYKIDKGKKAKIAKIYFLGEKKIREKN